jgi:hypothetical protein
MSKTMKKEELVNNSNQPQKTKEINNIDYINWYYKLGKTPTNEQMEEFDEEVQNWNLYDFSYFLNENGMSRWIRYYGIPLPFVQNIFRNFFPIHIDVNDEKRMVYNLKLTPHNEEFRNVKLNDGSFQGSSDRRCGVQYLNLRDFGELMGYNKN